MHLYNFMKQKTIKDLLHCKKKQTQKKKNWKKRIIESFGKNPLKCKRCGEEKILWKIWHKDYGVIYDISETSNVEDISYEPNWKDHKYTEKLYNYHCYKCNYWEWAPADFVDEFADMDEYCVDEYEEEQESKRKGMPVLECRFLLYWRKEN